MYAVIRTGGKQARVAPGDRVRVEKLAGAVGDTVEFSEVLLLENEGDLLPLARDTKVHVSGRSADDIGRQCGGWTISWQGNTGEITKGTSVRQAFEIALGRSGGVSYSPDGTAVSDAKVGIAVPSGE